MNYLKFIAALAVGLIIGLYGSNYLYNVLLFEAAGGEQGMLSFFNSLDDPGSNTYKASWYIFPLGLIFFMFFSFLTMWITVRISPIWHKALAIILGGLIGIWGATLLAITAGSFAVAMLNPLLTIATALYAVTFNRKLMAQQTASPG